jgi:hypothetical protein
VTCDSLPLPLSRERERESERGVPHPSRGDLGVRETARERVLTEDPIIVSFKRPTIHTYHKKKEDASNGAPHPSHP